MKGTGQGRQSKKNEHTTPTHIFRHIQPIIIFNIVVIASQHILAFSVAAFWVLPLEMMIGHYHHYDRPGLGWMRRVETEREENSKLQQGTQQNNSKRERHKM